MQWKYSLTFLIIGVLRFCHPASVDAVADANDESGINSPVQSTRKNTDKFDTPFCAPCDLKECPNDVTPEKCEGTVVKDDCNCCPICQTAAALSAPATPPTTQVTVTNITGNPCDSIKCPRKQICMLNIQNIPMCRCPSVFYCRRNVALEDPNPSKWRRKKKGPEVCGTDDKTYKSRCYVRIAECASNSKIKVKHRGACMKSTPIENVTPSIFAPELEDTVKDVSRTKPIKNINRNSEDDQSPALTKRQRKKQRRMRKQRRKEKLERRRNRDNNKDLLEKKRNKNKRNKGRKRSRKWRSRRRAKQMPHWSFAY